MEEIFPYRLDNIDHTIMLIMTTDTLIRLFSADRSRKDLLSIVVGNLDSVGMEIAEDIEEDTRICYNGIDVRSMCYHFCYNNLLDTIT